MERRRHYAQGCQAEGRNVAEKLFLEEMIHELGLRE